MKTKNRGLVTLVALGFLALGLFCTPAVAQDYDIPNSAYVDLVYANAPASVCGDGLGFFRVFGNGLRGVAPFRVPSGANLIVTDIQWVADPAPTATFVAGDAIRVGIRALFDAGVRSRDMYLSAPVYVTGANTVATLGGLDNLTTGFRVGGLGVLCASVSGTQTGFLRVHSFRSLRLTGFLISN
jgi:hypothetical protein